MVFCDVQWNSFWTAPPIYGHPLFPGQARIVCLLLNGHPFYPVPDHHFDDKTESGTHPFERSADISVSSHAWLTAKHLINSTSTHLDSSPTSPLSVQSRVLLFCFSPPPHRRVGCQSSCLTHSRVGHSFRSNWCGFRLKFLRYLNQNDRDVHKYNRTMTACFRKR